MPSELRMPSSRRLEGKVAIITGAASGIGESTAKLFVEHGAFVVLADIQDELGSKVASMIGEDKACYKHCDVTDEKQVEETVAFALEKYGSLDIMFSNAGIFGPMNNVLEMDAAKFDQTLAVNVRGPALTIKHAGRAMVENKILGSIICTASVEATVAGGAPVPYTTSKAAVVGLVKAAAIELGGYGIRVNSISPYGIATPMILNGFGMNADQLNGTLEAHQNLKGQLLTTRNVADAVLFLASNESDYISALNLVVDGGVSSRMIVRG